MDRSAPSTHGSLIALTVFAAIGSGSAGGVFFAFSSFVMKALVRLPSPQGIAAMQSINICVINPTFAFQLFGTAAVCIFLGAWALFHLRAPGAVSLLLGSLFYLGIAMLVTFVCNVPQNEALAPLDSTSVEAARLWSSLVPNWTAWNHVRTAGALAAATAFTIAILQFGKASQSIENPGI